MVQKVVPSNNTIVWEFPTGVFKVSVCLSNYLSICLSIHPSIHPGGGTSNSTGSGVTDGRGSGVFNSYRNLVLGPEKERQTWSQLLLISSSVKRRESSPGEDGLRQLERVTARCKCFAVQRDQLCLSVRRLMRNIWTTRHLDIHKDLKHYFV